MKLSIITITYNDGVGLEKTLKSLRPLLEGRLKGEWEHIIIDSSPEINSKVLENFSGWPLVHLQTPPRGIYPAFNLGIEHARGEFLWFLNGGDRMLNLENLKALLDSFKLSGSTGLICAPVEIYRNDLFTYNSHVKVNFISNLMGQNGLCHQGIIYRRAIFDRVGLYDESYKLAGDYEHHFKCFLKGIRFGVFDKPIAQYDRDGRSDNYQEVFKEYRRVWKKIAPEISRGLYFQNAVLGEVHLLRSKIMKSKLLSPFAAPLKKIWYQMHRN